jgi:hypothetical protein
MLRQLRGATLQIALTDFNYGEQPLTFALPFRFSMFAPQSLPKKTQVVRTTEQIA